MSGSEVTNEPDQGMSLRRMTAVIAELGRGADAADLHVSEAVGCELGLEDFRPRPRRRRNRSPPQSANSPCRAGRPGGASRHSGAKSWFRAGSKLCPGAAGKILAEVDKASSRPASTECAGILSKTRIGSSTMPQSLPNLPAGWGRVPVCSLVTWGRPIAQIEAGIDRLAHMEISVEDRPFAVSPVSICRGNFADTIGVLARTWAQPSGKRPQ